MKVRGMMSKQFLDFGENFWALSIFLFRKSFLETFLAPTK